MHILEDLYTGNVRPGERSFRQNSQYKQALAPAGHSSGLGMAVPHSDSYSLVGDLLQLGHDLERAGDGGPVKDSTTMPVHLDSKQRRQEREKKIALGHRPDDHEETFTYSMPTM